MAVALSVCPNPPESKLRANTWCGNAPPSCHGQARSFLDMCFKQSF